VFQILNSVMMLSMIFLMLAKRKQRQALLEELETEVDIATRLAGPLLL
jgi:hypothetical protein